MAGIAAAKAAGIAIKINAVALKGVNEDEYDEMIRWAHGEGMDLTLIETMPLGETTYRSIFAAFHCPGPPDGSVDAQ